MQRLFTNLRILIGLGMAALFLAAPAAAWTAHDLAHASAPVAVDDFHHHDDGSGVSHHGGGTPAGHDDEDGGHDHLLSLSVAVAAVFAETSLDHPPVWKPVPAAVDVKTIPLSTADPPPPRPPSFA